MSPVTRSRSPGKLVAAGLLGVATIAVAGFVIAGPKRVWEWVGGPADQGPVDFATLERRSAPNDALACTRGTCGQRVDFELPTYALAAADLMRGLDRVVAMSGSERVDDHSDESYRRYVLRTAVLAFPDTLDAKSTVVANGETALQLYSRSLLGRGDFGANLRRLQRIASDLGQRPAVSEQIVEITKRPRSG